MELQPLALLRRRGVLQTTLRHEYVHFVVEHLGRGRTPRWLAEGMAIHVAGEGAMFARLNLKSKWTRDEIERKLERPASADEMRELYAASYQEVRALIRAEGEKNVWRRIAKLGLTRRFHQRQLIKIPVETGCHEWLFKRGYGAPFLAACWLV